MTACGAVTARLYQRPRLRRALTVAGALWCAAVWSVATAPHAAAAGMGEAMSWTGLRDSYGVPVGAYFVSVVPIAEAVREQGPDFTVNPGSWGPAVMASLSTAMTYTQLASWLALECAVLIFVASAAIWFIKFALSAQWLGWLAALAAPLVVNVSAIVDRLYVMPIALLVCCTVGGVVALIRGVGRGAGIIVGGFVVVLLAAALLRDPVAEMVGDRGVLGVGRTLGFAVAQGGVANGPIAPGGSSAQLDLLGSWLCDVLLRQQIQLINFGMVVDDAGCGQLWSAAIMTGGGAAPAHAMSGCAPAALAHAQQLDATAVGMFAMLIAAVLVVTFALVYIGCEVFRIGFTAFVHLLVIIPAAAVAVAPGPPRRFAARTATKLVVHGVEMLAATAGLGIVLLLIGAVTRGSVPGTVGLTHPVAKLFVMMLLAVAGALAFRHLLHGFGDRGLPGPVTVAAGALGFAVHGGRSLEYLDYAGRRGRSVWRTATGGGDRWPRVGDTDTGTRAGSAPPGRRSHPPAADPRPPTGARFPAQVPGGPPRSAGGVGATGTASSSAGRNGVSVGGAAPAVVAPEVAVAAAVAQRVAQRGAQTRPAPGRDDNGPVAASGAVTGSRAAASPAGPQRPQPPGRPGGGSASPVRGQNDAPPQIPAGGQDPAIPVADRGEAPGRVIRQPGAEGGAT